MTKGKSSKSAKGRKPSYFVDNPNASELKWLDELKSKKIRFKIITCLFRSLSL